SFKLTISTVQMIQSVHSKDCLWNKYDLSYKDKNARDRAWAEVYREVTDKHASNEDGCNALCDQSTASADALIAQWAITAEVGDSGTLAA
ncbi:jg6936, partial [Pararge aegeria aegeria]